MMCHSPDFTHADAALRRKELEHTRELFHATAELGGCFCRVLSGQNRPGLEEGEALRWVIDQPGVIAVIPGARNVAQVSGNVAAAALPPLSAAQLSDLERLYDERIRAHVHDRW